MGNVKPTTLLDLTEKQDKKPPFTVAVIFYLAKLAIGSCSILRLNIVEAGNLSTCLVWCNLYVISHLVLK